MNTLESSLIDIMRAEQDTLKGDYVRRRASSAQQTAVWCTARNNHLTFIFLQLLSVSKHVWNLQILSTSTQLVSYINIKDVLLKMSVRCDHVLLFRQPMGVLHLKAELLMRSHFTVYRLSSKERGFTSFSGQTARHCVFFWFCDEQQ